MTGQFEDSFIVISFRFFKSVSLIDNSHLVQPFFNKYLMHNHAKFHRCYLNILIALHKDSVRVLLQFFVPFALGFGHFKKQHEKLFMMSDGTKINLPKMKVT